MLVLPITGVRIIKNRASLMMWSGIEACSNKSFLIISIIIMIMIIIIIMLLGIISILLLLILAFCLDLLHPGGKG